MKTELQTPSAHSRRSFLKGLGTAAVTAAAAQTEAVAAELEKANAEKAIGPGAVPVTLKVNGEKLKLLLEPRVTLLDALRNYSSLTGAKEGCDRASCGACTVLLGDLPIYACQKLAVEAQDQEVTTVEGLAKDGIRPLPRSSTPVRGTSAAVARNHAWWRQRSPPPASPPFAPPIRRL